MNKGIEYLPDGTIKFYQNKIVNLIASIASLLGLIIFAFIIFYFGFYEEEAIFFAFRLMILIETPIIIFFLFRFFKPKVLLVVNSQGVEIYGNKFSWEQIDSVMYKNADMNAFLNAKVSELSNMDTDSKYNSFIFKTKDNKSYVYSDLLSSKDSEIFRQILKEHKINWQE
jgi:hypothetical protein